MTIRAYLFDLDGTLCDSRDGIVHALKTAFSSLDIETAADPAQFIGAPLPAIFRKLSPGIDEVDVAYGIDRFRAAYEAYGIERTTLFPGVKAVLSALKAAGHIVWLATAKPETQAHLVLQATAIAPLFAGVSGAGDAEAEPKSVLIGRALKSAGVSGAEAIMLGDRAYDVVGALKNGVLPVGALWGFGTQDELVGAGCKHFAASMADFAVRFAAKGL